MVVPERVKAALPPEETPEILPLQSWRAESEPSRTEPYWVRRSQVMALPDWAGETRTPPSLSVL